MGTSSKKMSSGSHRGILIGGYVASVLLLVIGIVSAWQSTDDYMAAQSCDMRVAASPHVPGFLHEIAIGENPRINAVELRASARLYLTIFIAATALALAGLIGSGHVLRRTPGSEWVALLPEKIGLPRWLPWEPVLAGVVVIVFGMGPFSVLLPDTEGNYEITRIDVKIVKADFEEKFKLRLGSQPKLYVIVTQNEKRILNTARGRKLPESHTASYESPVRINWRHDDEIVWELRDDNFIGYTLLMRGGGAKSRKFRLMGTYRSRAGSTITFTSRYVGE